MSAPKFYCGGMAEEPVAWDYEQSRRAWRAYRSAGLRWLAVGVVCAVLVVGIAQLVLTRSQRLLEEGAPTTATVSAADAESVTFSYDAGGQEFSGTLDVVSGRDYEIGEELEVRYDRADPGTARLLAEPRRIRGVGPALAVLTLLAVGAVPIGAGVLLRARAWGRAMRREPWTPARLRVRGVDIALLPSYGVAPLGARMLSTTHWRRKAVQNMDGQELRMLPVGARDLVLTADGADTLFGLRRRT